MFGFLRRLLMAGDIKGVLEGSRRALRELSPELGERASSRSASEFLRSRGVDVPDERFQTVVPPWVVSEGFSNRSPLRFPVGEEGLPIAFSGRDMRGNALYIDPNTGRRLSVHPDMLRPGYSPIEAPYEGIRPVNPAYGTTREREAIANNLRARRDARMREDMGDPYLESGGEDLDYWEFERPQMNIDLYNQMARRVGRGQTVPSWWEYPYWNGGPETYFGGSNPELYPYESYVSRRPFRENFYTSNPTPFPPNPQFGYLDEGGLPF